MSSKILPLFRPRNSTSEKRVEALLREASGVESENPRKGLELYAAVLLLDSGNTHALVSLGNGHYKLGDSEGALNYYRRALAFNPEEATAWYNLGHVMLERMRYREAVEALEKAVNYDPTFVDAWYNLGLAHNSLGNWEEQDRCFRSYLDSEKEDTPWKEVAKRYLRD